MEMKVIIDCGGSKIEMERDDVPEIGSYVFTADSMFRFKVLSIKWSDITAVFEVSTERFNMQTGKVE